VVFACFQYLSSFLAFKDLATLSESLAENVHFAIFVIFKWPKKIFRSVLRKTKDAEL
jgi:hypothetical protein